MADLHYRITATSGFFSFTVQNIWKMATIIDKIAYHLCTVCLPAIVLRLPLTDTCYKFCQRIYSQYMHMKLHKREKHMANSAAMIAQQWLDSQLT